MPAPRQQSFVVFRGANDQFNHFAIEQQRLEGNKAHVSLCERQKNLNGGAEVNNWQARAPDPGFDIIGVGKRSIAENELRQLM